MDFARYEQYRETGVHEVPGFAYNTYLCTIPQDFARVRPHWHDQMEIVYVKRGSGTVSTNFVRHPVHAGSIVPILPGEIHAIDGDEGSRMEYENIIFSLDILDSHEPNDWCRANVLDPLREGTLRFARPVPEGTEFYERVRWALDGADAACAVRQPGYSMVVKSRLFLLLDALYAFRSADAPDCVEPGRLQQGALHAGVQEGHGNDVRPVRDGVPPDGRLVLPGEDVRPGGRHRTVVRVRQLLVLQPQVPAALRHDAHGVPREGVARGGHGPTSGEHAGRNFARID